MSFKLTNLTNGTLGVGGYVWRKGETKTIDVITSDIVKAVDVSKTLSSDLDVSPFGELAAVANTMNTATYNGGGTAAAVTDGAYTVAAITADATAQAAFATLFRELALANAAITALVNRLAIVESGTKQLYERPTP
jgi:hypothetical protein